MDSRGIIYEDREMAFRLPKFIDPKDRGYTSYANQLEQYNLAFQRELGEVMVTHLGRSTGDLAVFTTGSDGRLEKGPQSRVEVVISGRGDYSKEAELIRKKISEELGDVLHPSIEHKNIGRLFISGYNGDLNRSFPSRVLDLRFLYGNEKILRDTHDQLVSEICLEAEGRKIIDQVSDSRRRARKITERGEFPFKGAGVKHFDLETGVAYYDDENERGSCRSSFKQGPMRLVQYGMTYEVLQRIRNKDFDLDLIDNLPTNTADRLFYFETMGLTGLTHREVEDLSDSYKYFLWLYHLSQENFRESGTNETNFDKKEVKSRLSDLVRIVGSKRISGKPL